MIDQSHNVEGKIDAMIQSVMNIQTAYAKALLVDEARLAEAQSEGDVLGSHRILLEAFETDVRPLLSRLRRALGVAAIPSRRSAPAASRKHWRRARSHLGRERLRTRRHGVTQRSAFVLEVRPDRIDDYIEAHRTSGQRCSMRSELPGIRNYTIFRSGDQVFGYFEADDFTTPVLISPNRTSVSAGRTGWRSFSSIACPTPDPRR